LPRSSIIGRCAKLAASDRARAPLTQAIAHVERAHLNLVREIKRHRKDWEDRLEVYQTIQYDVSHIQKSILRVLNGAEPLKLDKPTFAPLAVLHK
jgi:hypothetical protein